MPAQVPAGRGKRSTRGSSPARMMRRRCHVASPYVVKGFVQASVFSNSRRRLNPHYISQQQGTSSDRTGYLTEA
jgi:hypothetical protein